MNAPHAPRRALILVDVQQEYFDGPLEVRYPPREESLEHILAAIDTAEQHGIPIAAVQHGYPAGSPVFAEGSEGQRLHPAVADRVGEGWKRVSKTVASIFPETDLNAWIEDKGIDTITLVGYMTNNCVIGTAADAEPRGLAVEVLSDATGAVALSNDVGSVTAQQVHDTLMVLLHSNFAAVGTTAQWRSAIEAGEALGTSDLVSSATGG